MDGKELVKSIEVRLAELGMKKGDFYKLTGITSASLYHFFFRVSSFFGMRREFFLSRVFYLEGICMVSWFLLLLIGALGFGGLFAVCGCDLT